MKRRTASDWKKLIEAQAASGLSAAAFCREHDLNAKYFSLRKTRLSSENSSFVKASIASQAKSETTLTYCGAILSISSGTSPRWVAQLLRELSA